MRNYEEHYNQSLVVKWFRANPKTRKYLIYAIPNAFRRTIRQGAWMKDEGMTAGIPDLCIPHASNGFNGMYIEMKRKNEKNTDLQSAIQNQLLNDGYCVVVCDSFENAKNCIEFYLEKEN
ncbi:MAG: VRR-NUC domain-containing protein [Candidatus Paceibacterota bacterium]|jgi:hypothetical protein